MPLLRFVVTALFASMLIRATFANTVVWRHPRAVTTVRHAPERKALAVQRNVDHLGTRT
jgi:hypothetical protein